MSRSRARRDYARPWGVELKVHLANGGSDLDDNDSSCESDTGADVEDDDDDDDDEAEKKV